MKKPKRGLLLLNYFKPSLYVESYKNINLDSLKNIGIKAILCDMDNTLLSWNERIPTKDVVKFIKTVESKGFIFILFSNNVKSRVENFAKKAGIKNYIWDAKKPLTGKLKILKNLFQLKNNEMIMIGDQLVTDILIANRSHIKSILVSPLSRVNNNNKFMSFLENKIKKKLAQKNILHEGFYSQDEVEDNYEIL